MSVIAITDTKSADWLEVSIAELASTYHEQWRKTRQQADGSFEPRMKTTTDQEWIAKHGTDQVDIANTHFNDLPMDWRKENWVGAQQGVAAALDCVKRIHNDWVARNQWAVESLKVPYMELARAEKIKHILMLRSAADSMLVALEA